MAKSLPAGSSSPHPLLLLFLLLLLQQQQTSVQSAAAAPACGGNGNVRGCLIEQGMEVEVEVELSSEESRRLLWAATEKKYISYEALKGDAVPCSKPGVPYYNCHTFPTAGPYTRGCQIISGCRGDAP
ncbi:protein RALF-like 22 [Curcuma longa]|uniref:protein RALF-like 22 n=1 Tax=Curcuma longa TaxID=136217 RepID=UPI003D9F913B